MINLKKLASFFTYPFFSTLFQKQEDKVLVKYDQIQGHKIRFRHLRKNNSPSEFRKVSDNCRLRATMATYLLPDNKIAVSTTFVSPDEKNPTKRVGRFIAARNLVHFLSTGYPSKNCSVMDLSTFKTWIKISFTYNRDKDLEIERELTDYLHLVVLIRGMELDPKVSDSILNFLYGKVDKLA